MSSRVEIRELVDPVQDIGDEFLEEDARRHPDLAAKLSCDRGRQVCDISIIAQKPHSIRASGMLAVDIANLAADKTEPL